jgi:hypothetical protein
VLKNRFFLLINNARINHNFEQARQKPVRFLEKNVVGKNKFFLCFHALHLRPLMPESRKQAGGAERYKHGYDIKKTANSQ